MLLQISPKFHFLNYSDQEWKSGMGDTNTTSGD